MDVSWISGNCQDNRHFSCYYADLNDFNQQWCQDSDTACFVIDDGGGLIKQQDNWAPKGGGW
jgi:hypothetical protein